jgi:hypothetical protein
MAGSRQVSTGRKTSSQQSERSVPPPINTDIDRLGRTPEENAERGKLRAVAPAQPVGPGASKNAPTPDPPGVHAGPGKPKLERQTSNTQAKASASKGTALPMEELWDFLTAFQHATEQLLNEVLVRIPSGESGHDSAVDSQEHATQLLFRVFKALATSKDEQSGDKHSNSMDLEEFLVPFLFAMP